MTIVICDIYSKDANALSVLWKNLNVVAAKHGVPKPKFKGFMADSTKANWNVVWIIYGIGDEVIPMKD